MKKVINPNYKNCIITEWDNRHLQYLIVNGVRQCDYRIEVKHKLTNKSINVLSLTEAYRIAKLLNLEYLVTNWDNEED
jgi:hypothetical protein